MVSQLNVGIEYLYNIKGNDVTVPYVLEATAKKLIEIKLTNEPSDFLDFLIKKLATDTILARTLALKIRNGLLILIENEEEKDALIETLLPVCLGIPEFMQEVSVLISDSQTGMRKFFDYIFQEN